MPEGNGDKHVHEWQSSELGVLARHFETLLDPISNSIAAVKQDTEKLRVETNDANKRSAEAIGATQALANRVDLMADRVHKLEEAQHRLVNVIMIGSNETLAIHERLREVVTTLDVVTARVRLLNNEVANLGNVSTTAATMPPPSTDG